MGTVDGVWEAPRGGDKEEGKTNKRIKSFISTRPWPKACRIFMAAPIGGRARSGRVRNWPRAAGELG